MYIPIAKKAIKTNNIIIIDFCFRFSGLVSTNSIAPAYMIDHAYPNNLVWRTFLSNSEIYFFEESSITNAGTNAKINPVIITPIP